MRHRDVAAVLVLGFCATVLTAAAQQEVPTAPPGAADAALAEADSQTTLETVEVTAQRRVEKLQEVPIAVTAFTSDQLQARHIEQIDDLNSLAPGLQISKTPSNSTISQITIRGSSQINPAIYWDPSVGLYLDGVYIGKAQGSIFDIVDLNRVEVLRGPQGTLYGRNTIGGTINLISRPPSGNFGGSASLEIGNYNAMIERVSVDLPKMGIARIALGARSERRDGWIDTSRDSPVREFNNRHNDGFRLAADLDVTTDFTVGYRFDHSNVSQTNNFDQLYRAEQAFFDFVGFGSLPSYASHDRLTFADVNSPSFEHSEVTGNALTLAWNLDPRNALKSITGYRWLRWDDSLDLDGSPLPVAFTQRFTDYKQFSQDLQFIGHTDRWNYVAGLYYFGDSGHTNNPQTFFGGGALFDSQYGTKTGAWAGYGQLDFRPLEPLTLTAGVRYTREKKQLDRIFGCNMFGNPNCTPAPGDAFVYLIPPGTHAENTFSATTPVASVAYKITQDVNLYVRYAEGFKSGGFNGEFSDPSASADDNIAETRTPFRPEKQRSLELGGKSTFFHDRAQINLALFRNKLLDLQTSTFLGTGAAASVIRNAGKATVQGVELETALVPIAGTQIRANYAYLDAKYDEFIDAGVNQADNRAFVHAPRNSFNVAVYSRLAGTPWGSVRALIDYVYTSAFYTYPYQLTPTNPNAQVAGDTQVQGYGLLNLRLALTEIPLGRTGGVGELALWCRNALDEDVATNFIDFGPNFGSLTVANFVEPRTFGLAGIVRW